MRVGVTVKDMYKLLPLVLLLPACCFGAPDIPEPDWYTYQGVAVSELVGPLPASHRAATERAIADYTTLWTTRLAVVDGVDCQPDLSLLSLSWEPGPIVLESGESRDGWTWDLCGTWWIRTSLAQTDGETWDSPYATVLEHEMGHFVIDACGQDWSHENMARLTRLSP